MRAKIRARRGATAVEYIVMLLLAAMVILAIMRVFGSTIESKYNDAHDELSGLEKPRSSSGGGSSSGGSKGSDGAHGSGGGSGHESGSKAGGEAGGSASGASGESGDGSGGSGGGSADGKGGVSGPSDTSTGSLYVGGKKKPPEEEGPGFNPIILLAAMGLVGLLFFVMSKGKDG